MAVSRGVDFSGVRLNRLGERVACFETLNRCRSDEPKKAKAPY